MSWDKTGMKCHHPDEHLHAMEMINSIWIEQKGKFSVTPTPKKVHLTKITYAEI